MYQCSECGNTKDFREINSVETYLLNGEKVDEKFICREDVICNECEAKYSEGQIVEVESNLPPLHTDIMTEISLYCAHECKGVNNCSEDECVLYRIERLVMEVDN